MIPILSPLPAFINLLLFLFPEPPFCLFFLICFRLFGVISNSDLLLELILILEVDIDVDDAVDDDIDVDLLFTFDISGTESSLLSSLLSSLSFSLLLGVKLRSNSNLSYSDVARYGDSDLKSIELVDNDSVGVDSIFSVSE